MDCKRKVLHVTGTMNRGGAEVMIMDLLENKSNNITYNFLIHYKKNTIIKRNKTRCQYE